MDTQKNYNSRDREAPETLSASAQLGHVWSFACRAWLSQIQLKKSLEQYQKKPEICDGAA